MKRLPIALRLGLLLVGLVVAAALLSLVWTPADPGRMRMAARLQGPSWTNLLGTDHFGRDILSMLMVGARNSLLVASFATLIGLVGGVALGNLAAAARGLVEDATMRLADLVFAFPAVLTAIMITAVMRPGAMSAILAIGIFNIPVFARVSRGAALQIRTRGYVTAALALGKSPLRVTLQHVLPNMAGTLIVQATIQFALAILSEAALSFLGVGVQPPDPSWGKMLSDAQTFIGRAPHLAIFPGLAIAIAVLGLNLLGDGLRDVLDPRSRRSRL